MTERRLVLDASAALSWFLDDEGADALPLLDLLPRREIVVPPHWVHEICHALLAAEKRGRATPQQIRSWTELLDALEWTVDPGSLSLTTAELTAFARARDLSPYDAAYLHLAERLHLPLITLDERLRRAAHNAGITTEATKQQDVE